MALTTAQTKDPAAVALGRKGGKKGGPARAAKLTPEERRESAPKTVQARWAKANQGKSPIATTDTSDDAVLALLKQIKETDAQDEISRLSNRLERLTFHTQYAKR